jgi:hypothetical protein
VFPLLFGLMVMVKNPMWHYVPPKNAQGQLEPNPAEFWFWQEPSATFPQLVAAMPPDPHLLTEDSTPVVLLGQRPVVMDAFAFKLMAERHLIDDADLVQRIDRREFNCLVMLRRVDDPNERLESFHFGRDVNDALRRQYRFDQQVGQYYLYRPLPRWHWWARETDKVQR